MADTVNNKMTHIYLGRAAAALLLCLCLIAASSCSRHDNGKGNAAPEVTAVFSPSPVPGTVVPAATEEPIGTVVPATPDPAFTPTPETTFTPAPSDTPTPGPEETPPDVTPEPSSETFDIEINVVGDCMLASYKNQDAEKGFKEYALREDPSYFLADVSAYFMNDDLTIANLECVLSDRELEPYDKPDEHPYWYLGPAANVRILTAGGVEAVSLANNHVFDYGEDGLADTVEAVSNAGLLWAGDYETFYYEKNGFRIAVICGQMLYRVQSDIICEAVRAASEESDFQIVYFHGGTMRLHYAEQWKKDCCRKIVDAGADLVLGAHPHVLQPIEVYNGVDIVYSLGNFCYGGSRGPENRTAIYNVVLTVDSGTGELRAKTSSVIPCYVYTADVNNFRPAPITDPDGYKKVIDYMYGLTDSPL